MNVVLYEPEIPPNTGSVARLCAATRTTLHLVEPLGFEIDDKHLKRAGLDYWPHVDLRVHGSWGEFTTRHGGARLLFFSKGRQVLCFRPRGSGSSGDSSRPRPTAKLTQQQQVMESGGTADAVLQARVVDGNGARTPPVFD